MNGTGFRRALRNAVRHEQAFRLQNLYLQRPRYQLSLALGLAKRHGEAVARKGDPIIDSAQSLIEKANQKGLILRVLGAVATRIHCPKFGGLLSESRVITDMDFISYNKQVNRIESFMAEEGYERRFPSVASLAVKRRIFFDRKNGVNIDIFLDKLQMCHDIDFRGRLEVDYPTIPLAEMLLAKLQIVQINEKDVKDVIIIIREHEIADDNSIDAKHIAKILSKNWGFYYTATKNLKEIRRLLRHYENLVETDGNFIESKIDKLLETIERESKSLGWNLRAKIGTKKSWYNKVEEIENHW